MRESEVEMTRVVSKPTTPTDKTARQRKIRKDLMNKLAIFENRPNSQEGKEVKNLFIEVFSSPELRTQWADVLASKDVEKQPKHNDQDNDLHG